MYNIYYGTNENAILSNLAFRPFKIKGKEYISVEHCYQCWKSGSFDELTYRKPWRDGSKFTGRSYVNKEISSRLMKRIITESLIQNPKILATLKATGKQKITHSQDKGFWGKEFPRILEELRETL